MPEFDDFGCSAHASSKYRESLPQEKLVRGRLFSRETFEFNAIAFFRQMEHTHDAETTLFDFKEAPSRTELLFFEKTSHIHTRKSSSRFFHGIIHSKASAEAFRSRITKAFQFKVRKRRCINIKLSWQREPCQFSSSVMNNTPKDSPSMSRFLLLFNNSLLKQCHNKCTALQIS